MDEIRPYEEQFCFCGTISAGRRWISSGYSKPELRKMEAALLETLHRDTVGFIGEPVYVKDMCSEMVGDHLAFHENRQANGGETIVTNHHNYEDALFNGMCRALDVLKEIHRSRGEKRRRRYSSIHKKRTC